MYVTDNQGKTPLDHKPEWRAELTELYEEVNRAWLARKSFLFVLIGGGHIGGSGGGPAGEGEQGAYETLRDDVLRNLRSIIMSFL